MPKEYTVILHTSQATHQTESDPRFLKQEVIDAD